MPLSRMLPPIWPEERPAPMLWFLPNPPVERLEDGRSIRCCLIRDCLSIRISLRTCCRSILCCIFIILLSSRKLGIGRGREERSAAFPAACADGVSEPGWRIAPPCVARLETGIEASPALFLGRRIPLCGRRSMSLLIAGPVLLTKRPVCRSKRAGACGRMCQEPRMAL